MEWQCYKKGKAIYPFWGASINLITGLDLLSLQTTSEATLINPKPSSQNHPIHHTPSVAHTCILLARF
jgi:hypothetical protein